MYNLLVNLCAMYQLCLQEGIMSQEILDTEEVLAEYSLIINRQIDWQRLELWKSILP
jgi:hypothetical protein